jgi:hypothetical protein
LNLPGVERDGNFHWFKRIARWNVANGDFLVRLSNSQADGTKQNSYEKNGLHD